MSDSTSTGHQIFKAAAETAPPAVLAAWYYLADQPIEKWLTVFAILYTILQIIVLVRREFVKRGRK